VVGLATADGAWRGSEGRGKFLLGAHDDSQNMNTQQIESSCEHVKITFQPTELFLYLAAFGGTTY